MKKRGRPTKITPELTERVVYLIERGMNQKDACNLAGLAYSTYNEWKAKGDKGFEPYATFFSVTSRARNEHKALLIRLVLAGAQGALKGDWKAGSWLLSKGWPKEFGDRIAVDADPGSIPAPTIILATPNGR